MSRILPTPRSLSGLAFLSLVVFCGVLAAAEPPLQGLARSHFDARQGLLVKSADDTILAALNPERPFHPASVTKLASTLAFLRRWGPDRRMRTSLSAGSPIEANSLSGDLFVRSEGDPYFVFENAFLVLLELNRLGIRRVDGGVRVEGPFFFNWSSDPGGRRFKQALAGQAGSRAWQAVEAQTGVNGVGLEEVALRFSGSPGTPAQDVETLLIHESAPLLRVLKEFNGYSNNIFHSFAHQIGGAPAVERVARSTVAKPSRSRVRIDNAAGGGRNNRLTPTAVVAILRTLERELASHGFRLSDVLPVAGIDAGTLEKRLDTLPYRGAVVGKTGTLPSISVSALAGVVFTQRYGELFFAILNQGLPIWKARKKQDAFLADLLDRARPRPPVYRPPSAPAFTEARIRRK